MKREFKSNEGISAKTIDGALDELKQGQSGGSGGDSYQATFNIANATGGSALSGTAYATLFIAEGDIEVSEMEVFVTSSASSTCYTGVYSFDGNTLLFESAISATNTGLQSSTLVGGGTVSLVGSTPYWFVFLEGAGSANFATKTSAGLATLTKSKFVSGSPTGLPPNLTGFTTSSVSGYIAIKS